MKRPTKVRGVSVACLAVLLALAGWCAGQEVAASPSGIPEKEIAALQKELAELRQKLALRLERQGR